MTGTLTIETHPSGKMMAAAIAESGRSFTGGAPSARKRALMIGGWVIVFLISFALFQLYDPALMDRLLSLLIAGGIGLLLGFAITAWAQRRVLVKFAEEAEGQGPTVIELSETHVTEHSEGQVLTMGLHRVRRVLRIDGGTVIRFSGFLFVVPDADLPDGMSPEAFGALLADLVTQAGGRV